MTNNQLTDAQISNATLIRLIRWADEHKSHYVAAALRELQERRQATMDSEPVAYMHDGEDGTEYNGHNEFSGGGKGIPLYRHAQPAVVSEKIIDNFEEEFRRAFEVSAAVEQLIEIGYQGDKFSLSIRDAATLWKLGRAAMLAAAPQSPGSEPATVPGKWIPVCERVPTKQDGSVFLTWNGQYIGKELFLMGSFQCLKPEIITHWMPLPAAPQEDINALIPLVSRNEQEVK
ncbi:DUF551 domain-containing protein [Klebsiella pneumoniae]